VLAVAHPIPWSSASFYLSSQSLADSRCNLHATSRSSHSRRRRSPSCRFLLCRVALVCLVLRRRRRLPLPCARGFSRLSSQLCPPRGIFWPPSSLLSSPRARTTLLTPTAIICRQVISLLRGPLSLRTLVPPPMMLALGSPSGASLQLTTGSPQVFRPPRSLLPRLPPVWLYVHFVQRGSPSMP